MTGEQVRRVALKISCERCGTRWHFRLRADRWDRFNETEPTFLCNCGAGFTVTPGEVVYVGRIPDASAAAMPHLWTAASGTWECGGCGQRWRSELEGEVQDLYMAENSNPTYICTCGSTLVLRQWNFHGAPSVEQRPPQVSETPLTETERLVLKQLVDGKPNREIATQLSLSEGTVRNAISSIYRKLGVKTRLQAANAAIRAGFARSHDERHIARADNPMTKS